MKNNELILKKFNEKCEFITNFLNNLEETEEEFTLNNLKFRYEIKTSYSKENNYNLQFIIKNKDTNSILHKYVKNYDEFDLNLDTIKFLELDIIERIYEKDLKNVKVYKNYKTYIKKIKKAIDENDMNELIYQNKKLIERQEKNDKNEQMQKYFKNFVIKLHKCKDSYKFNVLNLAIH